MRFFGIFDPIQSDNANAFRTFIIFWRQLGNLGYRERVNLSATKVTFGQKSLLFLVRSYYGDVSSVDKDRIGYRLTALEINEQPEWPQLFDTHSLACCDGISGTDTWLEISER